MENNVHTFVLRPDWQLINAISKLDRFDATWSAVEKREGRNLKQLKSIATVRSVGASTRIEGSKMTDDEVKVLIDKLSIAKLEDRDSQEVAGYFNALDVISEHYNDMEITESTIRSLHNILMKYSSKDEWHKGNYKQHSNAVEARRPDGTKHTIFQTTPPGFETENAIQALINWYDTDKHTHPMVKCALFSYDFVSIHPFQDGNGRLSRLLATLLLLKNGYRWIQYVSFEHEIENRKVEYYKELMQCQQQRPGEDIYPWVMFFLDCLNNISSHLMVKLDSTTKEITLAPKERSILLYIENHSGCQSGEIAQKLDLPLGTVKRILTDLVDRKMIIKHGSGPGTNYSL
jgi:Fic family protein